MRNSVRGGSSVFTVCSEGLAVQLDEPSGFSHPPQVNTDTWLKLLVMLVMVTGSPSWVEVIQEVLPPKVPITPLKTSPFAAVDTVVMGFCVVVVVWVGLGAAALDDLLVEVLLGVDDEIVLGLWVGELLLGELAIENRVVFATISGTLNGGNWVTQDATCDERLAFHNIVAKHAGAVEFVVVVSSAVVVFDSIGGNTVIQDAI